MSTTTTNATTVTGMTPYLHFTRGDYLLFKTWTPSSPGAIVGACIGLVVLALLDRYLAAMRSVMNRYWRERGIAMSHPHHHHQHQNRNQTDQDVEQPLYSTGTKLDDPRTSEQRQRQESIQDLPVLAQRPTYSRTIPPFIFAHDVPRGAFHAIQALLGYALMLSVMTFNASFIISIIVGLGFGEVLFGRMGSGNGH